MITSSGIEIYKVVFDAIIIIIAARDIILRKRTRKWYRRISSIGWIFLLFVLIDGIGAISKIFVAESEKNIADKENKAERKADRDTILNGVETAFNKHNLSYNPVTKTITILDTSARKDPNPVIDIVSDSTILTGTFENAKLKIQVKIINGGIAYNPRAVVIFFMVKNNSLVVTMKPKDALNETTKVYGINVMIYSLSMSINRGFYRSSTMDTTYIFFRATCTNKQINGTLQPPLRKVFYVVSMKDAAKLEDIKIHNLDDVNIMRVDSIQKLLKAKKYW